MGIWHGARRCVISPRAIVDLGTELEGEACFKRVDQAVTRDRLDASSTASIRVDAKHRVWITPATVDFSQDFFDGIREKSRSTGIPFIQDNWSRSLLQLSYHVVPEFSFSVADCVRVRNVTTSPTARLLPEQCLGSSTTTSTYLFGVSSSASSTSCK